MKQSKLYRSVSTRGLSASAAVQAHVVPMRKLWQAHVQSCMRRDIACSITINDYAILTRTACAYCGTPPANRTKYVGASILYNGVDRVDNARPYELENLVACCKTCNAMKSKLETAQFLEHVARVAAHQAR